MTFCYDFQLPTQFVCSRSKSMFKHAKKDTEPHVLMFYASPHGITPAVVTRELQPQNASIHDKKLARLFLPRINNGDIEDYIATAVSFTVWHRN